MDRRVWMQTDRPGERVAVGVPLSGVRVMSVSGSDRLWTEVHEAQTVCLVHAGQEGVGAAWQVGRSAFRTGSGEVMVMELGGYHRTTRVYGGAASFSVVQIDPALLVQTAYQFDRGVAPRLPAASMSIPPLSRCIARFVEATAAGADVLDLQCRLMDLVRELLQTCGDVDVTNPVMHRGIRRARDAIREQFSTHASKGSLQLDELASISGLSAPRFSHAFTSWMGVSPHAYLNQCRLSAARDMLERGIPATDVAVALGFADLPHLSRRFRRQFGLSPTQWAKLTRANSF